MRSLSFVWFVEILSRPIKRTGSPRPKIKSWSIPSPTAFLLLDALSYILHSCTRPKAHSWSHSCRGLLCRPCLAGFSERCGYGQSPITSGCKHGRTWPQSNSSSLQRASLGRKSPWSQGRRRSWLELAVGQGSLLLVATLNKLSQRNLKPRFLLSSSSLSLQVFYYLYLFWIYSNYNFKLLIWFLYLGYK